MGAVAAPEHEAEDRDEHPEDDRIIRHESRGNAVARPAMDVC
jgi:hypothetical protein